MFFKPSRIAFLSLAAFVAVLANADLKVISTVHTNVMGEAQPDQVTTTYYKGKFVRIDQKGISTIMNMDTHKSLVLDHKNRTYSEVDTDANPAAGMMPPMTVKIDGHVTPTDEHKTVADRQTTKYTFEADISMDIHALPGHTQHFKMLIDEWACPDISAPLSMPQQMDFLTDMVKMFGTTEGFDKVIKEFEQVKGWPLFITMSMKGDLDLPMGVPDDAPKSIDISFQSEATKVSEGPLNDALFRAPADYHRG